MTSRARFSHQRFTLLALSLALRAVFVGKDYLIVSIAQLSVYLGSAPGITHDPTLPTTAKMVLENAASDDRGTFADSSSPSDFDPYETPGTSSSNPSSATSTDTIFLDINALPSGLPILGPFYGFTRERLIHNINYSVNELAKQARRPLHRPEVEALAYHMAKAHAIASYGSPIGSLGGLWRAYNSREQFRWPFYKPDLEKVDLNKFGPLRGAQAVTGRHLARTFAYVLMGGFFGRYIVGAYAATVAATGTGLDPRLKDVVETATKYRREEASRKAASRGEGPVAGPGDIQIGRANAGVQTATRDSTGGYGSYGQTYAQGQAPSPNSSNSPYPTASPVSSSPYQSSAPSSSSLPFDFDDASPTAGNESMQGAAETSAWDRVRRGQSSAPLQARGDRSSDGPSGQRNGWESARRGDGLQREQQSGSTGGDAFAFERGDQERNRERQQAQKEFDQRLERERRGEDFGSAEGRWSGGR